MKRFRDKRKVISLTVVGIAYALIVLPLIISNVQKQQELRTKAQVAQTGQTSELSGPVINQSTLFQCTSKGEAELGVAYTNTDSTRSINVTATDQATGHSASLGTIAPDETKTTTIALDKNVIANGSVTFAIQYADNPSQTDTKTATYTPRSCAPFSPAIASQATKITADVPATCGNVTTDVVLIIDRSGSMGQNNKLVEAKNAAKNFIDVVSNQESTTRIGLVTFSSAGTLTSALTTDYNSVKTKIDALTASGNTCHECGVKIANQEIASHGRSGVKKVALLLTDGEANFVDGGVVQTTPAIAESKALDAVKAGFKASNTVFFAIGFDIKSATAPQFLTQVASLTGGKYYFPAPNQLDGVYQEISQLIGKGLIGGFIFNDANVNGAYDAGEVKLSGWTVKAVSTAGTKTVTSDSSGNYTLTGLCNGAYKVSQTMKSGWTQTLPTDPAGYSINIDNAGQFTDKLFGNTDKSRCNDNLDNDNNGFKDTDDSTCHSDGNPKNPATYVPTKDGEHGGNTCADSKDNNGNGLIDGADPICHVGGNPNNPWDPNLPELTPTPTPSMTPSPAPTLTPTPTPTKTPTPTLTPTPATTSLSLIVFLDGIGNRGDNTNPDTSTLSNKNPKHPTINADIQVFNLDNQLVASGTGSITYNATSGNYQGALSVPTGFTGGKYTVKVKADTYLRKLAGGIQTIISGQKNQITPLSLVAGDINNDNKLNIVDYNLLLNCYSDISSAANCSSLEKSVSADLNDDGVVNQIDYNLFLREIATQPGQ